MFTLKPRLSEKSYAASQFNNTFVFDVPGDLNKHTIAKEVALQFDVTVTEVRISNRKGKVKRTVRKGGRVSIGRDSDIKKAYVTLAKGSHLPFFEAEEKEAADAVKQEAKDAKKASKGASTAKNTVTAKANTKSGHRSFLGMRKTGDK
ncbi:MAG: 50S ribosomal protein L23 [Candidatus Saccharimonadales bacterium]